MPVHPTSYPGHDIINRFDGQGNNTFWPTYTDRQGRQRYYREHGELVLRTSYHAAWNYIASRNNKGMNKRARKGVR